MLLALAARGVLAPFKSARDHPAPARCSLALHRAPATRSAGEAGSTSKPYRSRVAPARDEGLRTRPPREGIPAALPPVPVRLAVTREAAPARRRAVAVIARAASFGGYWYQHCSYVVDGGAGARGCPMLASSTVDLNHYSAPNNFSRAMMVM